MELRCGDRSVKKTGHTVQNQTQHSTQLISLFPICSACEMILLRVSLPAKIPKWNDGVVLGNYGQELNQPRSQGFSLGDLALPNRQGKSPGNEVGAELY